MKWIRRIIIAFFTLSLLFIIVDIYSEKELSDAYNIYGLTERESLTFTMSNAIAEVDVDEYLSDLMKFADEREIVLISNKTDFRTSQLLFYYHTQEHLHEVINLPLRRMEDSLVYTTEEIKNSNQLSIMNHEMKVTFYPLSAIADSDDQKYYPVTAYGRNSSDLEGFKESFLEKYQHIVDSVDEMRGDQFDYQQNYRNQISLFFVLGIALFMIISLFQVSDNLNTISIMKMHGYGFMEITWRLLWKFIVEILILEGLVSLLYLVYYNLFVGPVPLLLLRDFGVALLITNLSLFCVLAVLVLSVNYIRLPKLLKGMNYNRNFVSLSSLTKIIMMVFLIPMIVPSINLLNGAMKYMIHLESSTRNLESTFHVDSMEIDNRFDGYSPVNYMSGETDEIFDKHKKVYDYFNNQDRLIYQELRHFGATDVQAEEGVIFYQGFDVNRRYFEESGLRDINGNLMKLDLEGNKVYVLVPESISKHTEVSQSRIIGESTNPSELIYIKDQDYPDYGAPYGNNPVLENNQLTPFFIVYSDEAFRHNQSILFGSYLLNDQSIEALHKELETVSSGNSYIIQSSEESKEVQISGIKNQTWRLGVTVLPGIVVFIILSLSDYVLYYRATMKKRVIYRHMGYSFLDANKELAMRIAVVYFVPVTFLLLNDEKSIFPAIFLLIILDILCWAYIHFIVERQSKTLKEISPLMNLG